MAGSLPGAATSLKTAFLVKQDKGFCPTKSGGTNGQRPFSKNKNDGKMLYLSAIFVFSNRKIIVGHLSDICRTL